MSNQATELWLQYTHLDKLYGYLPGMAEAPPAIFGLDPAAYAEVTALVEAAVTPGRMAGGVAGTRT